MWLSRHCTETMMISESLKLCWVRKMDSIVKEAVKINPSHFTFTSNNNYQSSKYCNPQRPVCIFEGVSWKSLCQRWTKNEAEQNRHHENFLHHKFTQCCLWNRWFQLFVIPKLHSRLSLPPPLMCDTNTDT